MPSIPWIRSGLVATAIATLSSGTPALGQAPPAFVGDVDADNPLVGRILDGATGADIPLAQLEDRLSQATVVLLGERHDNPDHHALQAHVLARMVDGGRRPALVFEMIDRDQGADLSSWRARPSPDTAALNDILSWEKRGWPRFSWYEPLFATALAADLPILPGNPPRDRVRAIARGEAPEEVRALGLDTPLPPAQAEDLRATLHESHCGMVPVEALAPIALAQRAKDATMARAVVEGLEGPKTDAVVVITGSEHARVDRGIPAYLPVGLKGQVLSIAFTEAFQDETDPLAYGEAQVVPGSRAPHDLLWVTPRVDRGDPCEGLAEHFRKAGSKGSEGDQN